MKLVFSILLTVTALSGCVKDSMDNMIMNTTTTGSTAPATIMTDSLSYLALGDSYTIGEQVAAKDSYPLQLAASMKTGGYPVSQPKIIAVTGWTTDNLINAINNSGLIGVKYRFVTLLIGVNDQFQGLSQANYQTKFAQVLNTAIAFAGNKNMVFVLSIPDYGVTPFAGGNDSSIGPQIDQFNDINKTISLAAGVNYLDITAISRMAATDPSLIALDGLHPSGKMYALWVARLMPMIVAQIKAGN